MGVRVDVAKSIMSVTDGNPLAIYIYPESIDIKNVAEAVERGESLEESRRLLEQRMSKHNQDAEILGPETYDKPIADALARDSAPVQRSCARIFST